MTEGRVCEKHEPATSIKIRCTTKIDLLGEACRSNVVTKAKAIPSVKRTPFLPFPALCIHVGCICIAMGLLFLCGSNIYLSDFDTPGTKNMISAFQYVAKAYEILLGASLGAVFIHFLHYQLCEGNGVPLQYISSSFQLSKIDQLLSYDFWRRADHSTRNLLPWFGMTVSLATIILTLLGPSSAILLIPELDWWPVRDPLSGHTGSMYINSSYDQLWPATVDASMIPRVEECLQMTPLGTALPPRCPFNIMPEVSQWLINNYNRGSAPNITKSADLGVIRYLTSSAEDATRRRLPGVIGYSVASSGMSFLSRNLETIWTYGEQNRFNLIVPSRPRISLKARDLAMPLRRPLVQVQCSKPYDITNQSSVNVTFASEHLQTRLANLGLPPITREVVTDLFQNMTNGPHIEWTDLTGTSNNSLMGALIATKFFSPQLMFDSLPPGVVEVVGLFACTISSHWIPTEMSRDPALGSSLILDRADPLDIIFDKQKMSTAMNFRLDRSWLDVVNAPVPDREKPLGVIAWILDWLTAKPGHGLDALWHDRWPWIMASVLSLQITDALSRLHDDQPLFYWDIPPRSSKSDPFVVNLQYTQNTGRDHVYTLPEQYNNDVQNFLTQNAANQTQVFFEVKRFGYAWSLNRITKYLATTVLLIYILIALAYMLIVATLRWRCEEWGNLTDLLILAIQSPPQKVLRKVAPGVRNRTAIHAWVEIGEDSIKDRQAVLHVRSNTNVSDAEEPLLRPPIDAPDQRQSRKIIPERTYF